MGGSRLAQLVQATNTAHPTDGGLCSLNGSQPLAVSMVTVMKTLSERGYGVVVAPKLARVRADEAWRRGDHRRRDQGRTLERGHRGRVAGGGGEFGQGQAGRLHGGATAAVVDELCCQTRKMVSQFPSPAVSRSSMGVLEFGRLSEAWAGEATDFTPLLAERLDQLGNAIGVDLASVGTTEVASAGGRRRRDHQR